MDKTALEALVRQVLLERLGGGTHGVKAVQVPRIAVTEEHRMDTGNPLDRVYTRDLFTLQESPRLGVGVMEMTDTTFPWTLRYDEMDYVLSGRLDIRIGGETVSAGPGGADLYPKEQLHPVLRHRARPLPLFRLPRRLAEPGRLIPGGRPSAARFFYTI